MSSLSSPSRLKLWLVALVVFAAAVRLIGLDFDDRHFFHPDERRIAMAVEELSFRPLQLNPHFFAYGSFPFYVNRSVASLLGTIDPRLGHYDGIMAIGRVISGLVGTLTVLLITVLGTRIYNRSVGLLAGFLLAACALHIQNSHYGTTDIFLTFLVTLSLSFVVGIVQRGWTRDYVFAGLAIGFAAATKFSALPLLAPLGVAGLLRVSQDGFVRVLGRGLLAVGCIAAAFAVGQPYALLDFANYARDIREQSGMVREAGRLPYTNQYIGVVKYAYDLKQLVLWGMAPPLGLVAIWATATRVVGAVRERSAVDAVLLAWVLPFFLITGSFDVKFVRYLLPIYPIMILWAAAWLWRVAQRSFLGRVALWSVSLSTGLAALAFLSIYTRPHTVVTASEWLYRNVPAGKVIATQHWDEGFPLPLPGQNPGRYKVDDLPYYEPDTAGKWRDIAARLAGSDYIAFQTKRLYGALTMAPEKYPIGNNYFYQLFAGDLGFTLVYDHASRPELFGIEAPDELADESITVYDHPKVLIFENTGRLSAQELYDRIMNGRPSKKLTRDDLLLASADAVGGTSESASPIRASVPALLWFALVVELLGAAAFAVLRRWLPVPGVYGLAKVLGVLLFAYVPWLVVSLGQAPFTRGPLAATFGLLLLWGGLAWRRGAGEEPAGEWAPTELLFWGAFLLFLAVRAFNPEIFWGEKPMDFSFLNTLTRATTLPPPEPWFSGSTLHYTYFGHYVVAALGKLCNLHPGLTFNLGIALFGALTASAAFALGSAVGGRRSVGLLCAVFVVLIGNLAGLREVVARQSINFDYFWATSRVIKDTINEYPFWSFLFADLHAHVLVMPFSLSFLALAVWWVRRADAPATVRPLAAYVLLAFVLGAIMVTNGWSSPTYILFFPFLLGCTALAQTPIGRGRRLLLALLGLAAIALIVSRLTLAHQPLPGWLVERLGDVDVPRAAVTALAGVAGAAVFVLLPGPSILTAILVGLAYLLFLPFWRDFSPPPRNFGLEDQSFANAWDFANIFGLYLFIGIPFVFALWRRTLGPASARLGVLRGLAMWVVALAVLGCWVASVPGVDHHLPFGLHGSLRAGLAVLALLAFSVAVQGPLTSSQRVAAAMLAFAFAITAGTDVVFVWDRMNTIFKFYLEAWFFFSAACAAAAIELWHGLIRRAALRRLWQGGLLVLVAIGAFTAGTGIWAVVRTDRVPTPEPTLDGTAYLAEQAPLERAAYEWLNDNVAGIPVLAEAYGPSYQEYSRVAMNTGLPIVLGWDYHVSKRAQRWPDINKRKDDLKRLYTTDNEQVAAEILKKYHIALVYVGNAERRAYSGGNLKRFQEWNDLLKPIYSNPGVTVFAVAGQYAGAIPVTAIQEVPPVPEGEEVRAQGAPGQLSQPRGLALDKDGNVYVADFGNDRVQKFDAGFGFVKEWGSHGDLPDQFKQPGDLAVAPDGTVYVADTWNQRVQAFSPDGEYRREWSDKYYGPRGIAVGPDGVVYLADTGNHRVRRFTPAGIEERSWGGLGSGEGQFTEPVGIAVDANSKVYVADNGNARLQIFDRNGSLLGAFPVDGWEQKVFSEPHVAVAPDGTIWVTVPTRQLVRAYSPAGAVVKEIQGGDDPGMPFNRPMGLAYDRRNGTLVVSDLENRLERLPAK